MAGAADLATLSEIPAVACFLVAAIGNGVRGSEKIAPVLIEIDSVAPTSSYTFDRRMQVAIGSGAPMNSQRGYW